jgi:phosphoglycolate phosphatase-like HAD superfamily hydrolase
LRKRLWYIPAMNPLIALDADGVLLDFHQAYASAWERAFGARPALRDPKAYWPIDRWDVQRLSGAGLETLRACFDETFWSSVPALPGALDACQRLVAGGFRLVCVSAVDSKFAAARETNLSALGFPLDGLVATGHTAVDVSPKAEALARLKPVAFVDDYLPYHRGVHPAIHKALVMREPNGSPNTGPDLQHVDSQHPNLGAFADMWLRGG